MAREFRRACDSFTGCSFTSGCTKLSCLAGALLAALIGTSALPVCAQHDMSSFAFVQNDGSLRLAGELIHLYGIYIPPSGQTCYTFVRPIPCGTRASLALDFRISGDFVHCLERARTPDGSIVASCRSGSEDLSEWMLQHGWAVALPDAPFEYVTMERIAQSRGIGIWGIPVDTVPQQLPDRPRSRRR